MKRLPDIYRLILEAEEPPPEPIFGTPINPPRKQSGVVIDSHGGQETNPHAINPTRDFQSQEEEDNWFGWDEWSDPSQHAPPNWPRVRVRVKGADGNYHDTFIPFPPNRPDDYPSWEEWPPEPGHPYYDSFQNLANNLVQGIPPWIQTIEQLYQWAFGILNNWKGLHLVGPPNWIEWIFQLFEMLPGAGDVADSIRIFGNDQDNDTVAPWEEYTDLPYSPGWPYPNYGGPAWYYRTPGRPVHPLDRPYKKILPWARPGSIPQTLPPGRPPEYVLPTNPARYY